MSRPFKLYRLQQIDSQIDWMNKRLGEIDTALKDDQALKLAEKDAADAEQLQEEARKSLKRAENHVSQQNIKIEQNEATLYSGKVQNPKELQDLQNESASLKRYLEVLEERQLIAMLAEEEASSELQIATEELEKARQNSAQTNAALYEEKDKLDKDIERLQGEHQAAANSVEAEDLAFYKKLRTQRRGIAVSKVSEKACSACGSTLNSVLLYAARSPNQINCCDICGRILYAG